MVERWAAGENTLPPEPQGSSGKRGGLPAWKGDGMSGIESIEEGHGSRRGAVLRLSTTDRCNLRCCYCMPVEGLPLVRRDLLLDIEDLTRVAAWLCRAARVDRIKLTGGEPLVRSGVEQLIRLLAEIPGVNEVSATTNGTLLARRAAGLRAAGLTRVNVSVDTLDPDHYQKLTRGGCVEDVIRGIDAAVAARLRPVKLNAVLMASRWRRDVPALLDFAQDRDLEIRFIELMRTGTEAPWAEREFVPAATVRAWLAADGDSERLRATADPARRSRVSWRGRPITVGWITPRSQPFCSGCRRIRLDARGLLRRCLMDPVPFPLAKRLAVHHDADVRREVDSYLAGKREASGMDLPLPMVSVGG